ncbi:hypothetical protein [Klebsiella aerogenes]|nr:hypothetical protein [Klebsiella aerogenes]
MYIKCLSASHQEFACVQLAGDEATSLYPQYPQDFAQLCRDKVLVT